MPGDVAAIVLAAGLSSRMDRFKPLAPLGDSTVLGRVMATLACAGVEQVLVVTGHRAEEVAGMAKGGGARAVRNPDYHEGMFTSVRAGVKGLDPETSGFFLLPVDIPLVRPATLRRLIEVFDPGSATVVHPAFLGRRGHPPLLSAQIIPRIMKSHGHGGLRAVLERFEAGNAHRVKEVTVADAGVLQDMDTEQDYLEVCRRWASRGLPSQEECRSLLDLAGTPERARLHGRAVARVAVALGRAVNQSQARDVVLDLERIERAALVHDLAKGHPSHEQEGGRLLSEWGFTDIAAMVAAHRDLAPEPGSPVSEQEVVFLADKVVAGTELVPLERRYDLVLERHGADPEARKDIQGRKERALRIAVRVEAVMGKKLQGVATTALETDPKTA
ncbi:MAG: DVU_1551 family NTP transferase [Desulfohalobiaceae bacterium]